MGYEQICRYTWVDTIQVYVPIGCYYAGTLAESVMCINICLMLTIGAH